MLPQQCRELVMRLSHDVPMAGHLGITKMKDRILQRYYWPGIFMDVANYCRGCEVCQRSTPRKPAKAGLVPIPIVTRPFQRIGMNIMRPLPRTQRGNRFILTICDYATRYPEAVALPSVEAPRIARELVHLCSRMGIPDEILTDQGTNFMSSLLEEVSHCVSLSPEQKGQLQSLLGKFPEELRSVPGRTHLVEHEIHVGEASPIHQKPYRVPYSRRELVKEELDKMLEARIIQPSTSPWASPIVLVPKKGGGVRFCVDYRRLNKVAKFDAYPMVRMEEIFERIGSSNVVSTLDLAKGYWQIPMAANSRDKPRPLACLNLKSSSLDFTMLQQHFSG